MPIYEYWCPRCQTRFEVMKGMAERKSNPCPSCHTESELRPSRFSHYWFHPFFVDGEGFTSKYVRNEELAEMNQEIRER